MNDTFLNDFKVTTGCNYSFKTYKKKIKNYPHLKFLYYGRKYQFSNSRLFKKIYGKLRNKVAIKLGLEMELKNIGKGLHLVHPYDITIIASASVGDNLTIFKGATIGCTWSGSKPGSPIIGSNVTICANAMVCGNIRIGNNSFICAGAFVNFDVPENSLVLGNPGVIHKI